MTSDDSVIGARATGISKTNWQSKIGKAHEIFAESDQYALRSEAEGPVDLWRGGGPAQHRGVGRLFRSRAPGNQSQSGRGAAIRMRPLPNAISRKQALSSFGIRYQRS